MIDQKLLLNDLESCIKKWSRRKVPKEEITNSYQLILKKNKSLQKVEELRHQKKQKSTEIRDFLKKNNIQEVTRIKKDIQELKSKLEKEEKILQSLEKELELSLLNLPNFPHEKSPEGKSSKDNVEILRGNFNPETFSSQKIPPHWEVMEELDIFDQTRASKISGSMFCILKGSGAKLLRSLITLAFDTFEEEFTEFVVPSLVNTASLTGTGQLPKFKQEAYHIEKDDLWAIPTGEVPLTALHRSEILNEKDLPLKYMTHTPCFRREAGAAGQDNRGLQRLHEFHKLELVKICKAQQGEKELESLLKSALKPIQKLKLPYRILDLCPPDLTFSSARTYDIEVYSPGTQSWLEVSSVSLFTDYQSRRSQIRWRGEDKKIHYAYTLNGSGLASPRVMACILEIYREGKGKVKVPEALTQYMKQDYL
ncbi:MAG: serine--tRNA ligase [Bdellovibrionales bacterium]|nr:serine--tRNA ligase [Bdellovibrionales bacterium]